MISERVRHDPRDLERKQKAFHVIEEKDSDDEPEEKDNVDEDISGNKLIESYHSNNYIHASWVLDRKGSKDSKSRSNEKSIKKIQSLQSANIELSKMLQNSILSSEDDSNDSLNVRAKLFYYLGKQNSK